MSWAQSSIDRNAPAVNLINFGIVEDPRRRLASKTIFHDEADRHLSFNFYSTTIIAGSLAVAATQCNSVMKESNI